MQSWVERRLAVRSIAWLGLSMIRQRTCPMPRYELPTTVLRDPYVGEQEPTAPVLPSHRGALGRAAMNNGYVPESAETNLFPIEPLATKRRHRCIQPIFLCHPHATRTCKQKIFRQDLLACHAILLCPRDHPVALECGQCLMWIRRHLGKCCGLTTIRRKSVSPLSAFLREARRIKRKHVFFFTGRSGAGQVETGPGSE